MSDYVSDAIFWIWWAVVISTVSNHSNMFICAIGLVTLATGVIIFVMEMMTHFYFWNLRRKRNAKRRRISR